MKKRLKGIGLGLLMSCVLVQAQIITLQAEQRAKEIMSEMTLKEKIEYLSGYTRFSLRPIPRLGIPEVRLADGPQGLRNYASHSTMFPSGILSAATWNRELVNKLGRGLGQDSRARGVSILLGPGVNLYRAPFCGRNFEYFGEDPYLASEVAKYYILGVQSEGVIATIKHFAANNQEWNRHHVSSDIDERTLHEIYFPTFEKAVKEAYVGAVMNSYNMLNGVHATENKWLNIDLLREMWGFKGILMSDWGSVYSTIGTANAGMDLEMPDGKYLNVKNLLPVIKKGLVTEATINLKVQHILQTLIAFGVLDKKRNNDSIPLDNPFSRQVALDIAREGVVLLKNRNNQLPLKGKTAVLGPNANCIPTGAGSGFVSPFSKITVVQGLQELKNKDIVVLSDDIVKDNVKLEKELAKVSNVVVCVGFNERLEGEGWDRPFALPRAQEELIRKVASLHDRVVVVVNAGGGVDFFAWEEQVEAILMAWYPGQGGGRAIAEILVGVISPSGKLPISIERKWEDNPVFKSYYENQKADYKRVSYDEGVFVGYRGYDLSGISPHYPFGFGLSYTTFEYNNIEIEKIGKHHVKVSFDIKNTGKMDAYEVAQVYVCDIKSSVPRPYKELKGFEKIFLKKGEMQRVSIELNDRAFSYYDMDYKQFVVEPGEFEILVGGDSGRLPLKAIIEL